jgi:hypothetical protein
LPISCVLLLGQSLWLLLVPAPVKPWIPRLLCAITIVPAVLVFIKVLTAPPSKDLIPTTWDQPTAKTA